MKLIRTSFLFILFFCLSSVGNSQGFSPEIYSGVNYSDIHGQSTGGKWDSKPGPASGINLGYSVTKTIGIQTGVNFSTVYYEFIQVSYPLIYYDYMSPLSSYYDPRISAPYFPASTRMDFSFVRIPLLFTVSVPSILELEMRAGIFFSFLRDYSASNNYYYNFISTEKPEGHDFGYILSSGLSYPLNEKFKASLNASYITGRKPFLENYNYKHGSSEFSLGLEYTGFLKHKNHEKSSIISEDSVSRRVTVTIKGGVNYSWNGVKEPNGNYYGCFGPVLGFSVNVPVGKKVLFQTGFTFERKGYSIRDSSASFYRLNDGLKMYDVDTKVQTDYAIIPAVFTFPLGKTGKLYLSTGPWLGLKLNAHTVGVAYNEEQTDYSYQLKETIVNDDLEEAMGNYDIGWLVGFGIKMPVADKYDADLSLQYSAGFREAFKGSPNIPVADGSDLSIRNRTVSLVLGFRIPYAGK